MLNGLPRITFAMSYGLSFASLTSTIVHTFRMYQNCLCSVWRLIRGAPQYGIDMILLGSSGARCEMRATYTHALCRRTRKCPSGGMRSWVSLHSGLVSLPLWCGIQKYALFVSTNKGTLIGYPAASYLGIPTFSGHRRYLSRSGGDAPSYHQPASWSQVRLKPWFMCDTVLTWS
jgi:hypothetical protein